MTFYLTVIAPDGSVLRRVHPRPRGIGGGCLRGAAACQSFPINPPRAANGDIDQLDE
jgi:hypothetical protein